MAQTKFTAIFVHRKKIMAGPARIDPARDHGEEHWAERAISRQIRRGALVTEKSCGAEAEHVYEINDLINVYWRDKQKPNTLCSYFC